MRATDRLNAAALLLRLAMGVMFIAHGLLLKVLLYTPSGTAEYFASIGYPPAIAYFVIAAETVGGLLLITGYMVRLTSMMLVPIMIGATAEHIRNGWLFSNEGGGWEFPLFWLVALLIQALLGPGRWSLDAAVAPRLEAERA